MSPETLAMMARLASTLGEGAPQAQPAPDNVRKIALSAKRPFGGDRRCARTWPVNIAPSAASR